ncbi:Transmembrane transporter protein, chloroquine resistant [Nannochloropsis gaditana]|uniref:Transmembrane transporter protein, chloroquine resistant n=1 Tax=Nannochloropsis gaditana TaxID=72520 RepID=W7TQ91_9STRA|nr:Transmembrane transporter protein, chloroquine resistant [Nannochloropsis gaditana]
MADEETPLRPAISTSAGTSSSTASTAGTTPIRRPSFLLSKLPPPPPLEPETAAKKTSKAVKLAIYVFASTFTAAANAVWFKKMLNAYRPNFEFFGNQFNVFLYVLLAALVVLHKRVRYGAHWWHKQDLPLSVLCFMGFLDATGSILSTMGGAYTAGAVQTLLNQVIIPMTLALSFLCLGQRFTGAQTLGALTIFIGAGIAIVPSFLAGKGARAGSGSGEGPPTTTLTGVLLFFSSILPGAFSNVYKEWGFAQFHVDLYYLTTFVSAIQVLFGFAFLPALQVPIFGGMPLREIPQQFTLGFKCFRGINTLPGDDCKDAFLTMWMYVLINFLFNVLQLLITKHGGATLLVISAALALPVTNFAFSMTWIMGEDTEPFNPFDAVALAVVLVGFLLYSAWDDLVDRRKKQRKRLPIQFAAGSVMYLRERADSDPSTPGYTPIRVEPPRRRGSIDVQLNRAPHPDGTNKGISASTRLLAPSKAVPILLQQKQQRRREEAGGGLAPGRPSSYQIDIVSDEVGTVSL